MSKRILAALLSLVLILPCIPLTAFATETMTTLTVEKVYATPGSTVTVDVEIANNPGILGATLTLSWDEGLTLTGCANGLAFSELTFQAPSRYISGCNFVWYGSDISVALDGTVLSLTFEVAETVEADGFYAVNVTYDSRDILDRNYNSVELSVVNGGVRILTYMPGDVTGDERINPLDLIKLSQYISDGCVTNPEGFNVTINEYAADVNDDNRMNPLDLILISRYISDGCITDPDGYNVRPVPHTPRCEHTMQATERKEPTCTEDGNIAYWYCTQCEKYFSNESGAAEIDLADTVLPATDHTWVIDPEVPPTATTEGLTEGRHCSVCGHKDPAQEVIPPTAAKTHSIEYDITNGDPYLENLFEKGELINPNASYYAEGEGLTLKNPSVAGYRFLGWYDFAVGGTLIQKIDATATDDYQLYAHWSKIEYKVQYKSSLFVDRAEDTYTVDTGLVLPTPKMSSYTFTGWADEEGKLYRNTMIPVGSTGNLVLEANWTSERNKTWTKKNLDEPTYYKEDNKLFFVYEIGEIQNVPLYTIKDFGYITEGGIMKTEETTFSMSISEGTAQQISEAVGKATTSSSNWTLSNGWTEGTDITQEWLDEKGYTYEEAKKLATNKESNWNVSTGTSGSSDTSIGISNEKGWSNETKISSSSSATVGSSINAGLETTVGAEGMGMKAEVSASLEAEVSASQTASNGVEMGGSTSGTTMQTGSTSTSSGWSNSSSYGGSSSISAEDSVSKSISAAITEKYGYGKNYTTAFESGESQGLECTTSGTEEWSNSVTYNIETGEEVTRTWTTAQTKEGYHRWIMAGIAHVFAVVSYDMETQSYFVYTYTVMDDYTYEYEDFSYVSPTYNDHENGVISFEIPYEVAEIVAENTVYTQGLKVDQETGIITGYEGTDNCVVIPEYMNVGGGDVVKIVGIKEGAFMNNTNISAVILSDFITEIPDNCFSGCTNLEGTVGGNITKIGDNAFAGTKIVDCAVRSQVEYVGDNAFEGVEHVYFNCGNAQVLEAADNCGAKNIHVYLKYLENISEANGIALTIPEGTEYFEINANGETVYDMTISSDADETVFTKIHFQNTSSIPVKTSSAKVAFNQSSVSATGMALVLSADHTDLYLQSTISISSANENAILSKSVALYDYNSTVNGYLSLGGGKLLYVDNVENTGRIVSGTCEQISADMFNNMLTSYTLIFDANGGSCTEESRNVPNSTKIGTLPVPTREYYTFGGWFLADGTEVTADTVFSNGSDVTVYAKWIPKAYTVSWNTGTGYSIIVNRTSSPNAGAAIGQLNNGAAVYYGDVLTISYTASTGYSLGSQGKTSVTVTGNVTSSDIYTSATVNSYTASWNTGVGYTITVKRTSSPLKGASIGTLNNGAMVYYGDVLAVTYAANEGYSLKSNGKTSITVTGNVTGNDIYATVEAKDITYKIVYQSSNGTALGTSTVTHKFGTTNTISAPAKAGYNTPSSHSVQWDSVTSKTITFIYVPTTVDPTTKSGQVYNASGSILYYDVTIEHQNRTADSVQLRVTWKSTLSHGYLNNALWFRASVGSVSTGNIRILSQGSWGSQSNSSRTATNSSGWITVSLNTTNATSVSMSVYHYQANYNGTDLSSGGYANVSATWTVNIPAF